MGNTVKGTEAIGYLTSHTFNEDKATIVETQAGIDVDNAGRRYASQYATDYRSVMWDVLNYMPTESSLRGTGLTIEQAIEGLYEVGLVDGDRGPRIAWFAIHTGLYDSESLGIHYEFTWEV